MAKNSRVKTDIKMLLRDNNLDKNKYWIEVAENNMNHIKAKIMGPIDSPYDKGVFDLDIIVPDRYPHIPPKCKFVTHVWHPNISSATGCICLDILTPTKWSSVNTIESILISVQSLLDSPNPDDPQDNVVASQYKSNVEMYKMTAKYWTYFYAVDKDKGNTFDTNVFKDFDEKIAKFIAQKPGSSHEMALIKLSNTEWILDKALKL